MEKKIYDSLKAAFNKRAPLLKVTNAVRLVNGLGDKLPGLVLEQYDRHVVAYLFDRLWLKEKADLAAFVKERLSAHYFIVKERFSSKALKDDAINARVLISEEESKTTVTENGLQFEIDLNDGLNSGLFLDMRANRQAVATLAKGLRVFNGFAYTCSFGVYCRAAGAGRVVNLDISRKALDRGLANYTLNNLEVGESEFIRADAAFYLARAVKKDNRFDLIILDPPSFARHEGKAFSVKKDLPQLLDSAVGVLNPGGIMFVSSNFSSLSPRELETMLKKAGGKKIRSIEHRGQDVDFPGSGKMAQSYLAAVLVRIN